MRRRLVLRVLRSLQPSSILEAGAGDGSLMVDLSRFAIRVVGVEPGAESYSEAKRLLNRYPNARVFAEWDADVGDSFDCLVALEVLEHLADDVGELRRWLNRVRTGGHVILSVPAHMRYWTAADVEVGHVRRYAKSDLLQLMNECLLTPLHLWSYGFPVTILSRRLRSAHTVRTSLAGNAKDRTLGSARASYVVRGSTFWRSAYSLLGFVGHLAQLPFRNTELGDGWLVLARKD